MAIHPIAVPTSEQRRLTQHSAQDLILSKIRELRVFQNSPNERFDVLEAVMENFAPGDRIKIASRYSENILNYEGGKKERVRQGTVISYGDLGDHFYMSYKPENPNESGVFDFDPVVYENNFIDYEKMHVTSTDGKVTIIYSEAKADDPDQVGFSVEIERLF